MPSKDPVNPTANTWMVKEGLASLEPERPAATVSAARGRTGSRTVRPVLSGIVQALARRLGRDPESLAARIPDDTIRRTKYPVIQQKDDAGRLIFKEDPGITEGRRALVKK